MRRGLFVDLDGTLADSLGVMRQVYFRLLADLGRTGSDAEFEQLNGPPLPEIVRRLIAAHQLDMTSADMLARYRAAVVEAYDQVQPHEGAATLLAAAKSADRVTGLVTSNARALAERWLGQVGLASLIDLIVGGDEVARGKPDPLPYLMAIERGDCRAADSLAVEDSTQGAAAAVAAGLRTFGLSHGATITWPPGVTEITRLDLLLPEVER